MNIEEQMDRIYRETSMENIPWVRDEPPPILAELVKSGTIAPCHAADLGCGTGNCAVWLARQGFSVTGYDCSGEAIRHAETLAANHRLLCRFKVADLTRPIDSPEPRFDFVYHWGVLHHVFPEDRTTFAGNVERMLKPGGKHLCMCFSEEDTVFGSREKYRTTPLGTTLYFSSEHEIRELFETGFKILDLHTAEIPGEPLPHKAVVALMETPWQETENE